MTREEHLKIDQFLFRNEYNDIHKWINGTFWKYANNNPYKHWLERHHEEAIIKEYKKFTEKYNVAYIHILIDWLSHFGMAIVPKNKDEVIQLLSKQSIL